MRAKRLRQRAHVLSAHDAVAALRTLQEAKRLLHRAYWESGRATPPLRAEIDENARLRTGIIDAEIAKEPTRRLDRPRRRPRR